MKLEQFRSHAFDREMADVMAARATEFEDGFTVIASENHPHPEDIAAKRDAEEGGFEGGYYEGYPSEKGPGKGRYYQGCEQADRLEELARSRVREVLGKKVGSETLASNVQVPTGAMANLAVYLGVMKPGDTMVAPSLGRGYGHLSHGADSPSAVGKMFNCIGYGINPDTGLIDYDELERLVLEHQPRVVLGGASSYPRDIEWERIAAIANKVGAISMADISHPSGLVAAGLLRDPFSCGIDVVTTTTHKTLRGLKGAVIAWNRAALEQKVVAGSSALKTSGIDFGVFPGMFGGPHMPTIAAHASTFRRALTPEFRNEMERVKANAAVMAKVLKEEGWDVLTGGTDNHIVLVDVTRNANVRNKATRDGWEAAIALENVGVQANKNAAPLRNEIRGADGATKPATPVRPPAIRLGSPAVTARGMGTGDIAELTLLISDILKYAEDATKLAGIRDRIRVMARLFPVPKYDYRPQPVYPQTRGH